MTMRRPLALLLAAQAPLCGSWQHCVDGEIHARPTFSRDGATIYVSVGGGDAVVALEASSGRRRWGVALPCDPKNPVWQKDVKCGAAGTVLSRDGRVLFVAGLDNALRALRLPSEPQGNATVLWRYAMGAGASGISSGAALGDDGQLVFVAVPPPTTTTPQTHGPGPKLTRAGRRAGRTRIPPATDSATRSTR